MKKDIAVPSAMNTLVRLAVTGNVKAIFHYLLKNFPLIETLVREHILKTVKQSRNLCKSSKSTFQL